MRMTARIVALTLVVVFSWGCAEDEKKLKQDTGPTDSKVADKKVVPEDTGPGQEAMIHPEAGGDAVAVDAKITPDVKPDAASGKHWAEFPYKPSGKLYAIWGTSASQIWAVGQKGVIAKYNGTTWASETNPVTSSPDLWSIAKNNSTIYAVGAGVVLYNSAGKWVKGYSYATSTYYNFRDIWASPSAYQVWGAGEMGYYLGLKTSSSPSSSWYYIYLYNKLKVSMYGIWGASTSKIWAVGNKGTIFHCKSSCTTSGTSSQNYWNTQQSGTTSNLRDVYGFSATDVFAVGYDGTIIHYDGTKWSKMVTNTSTYFQGVWGSSPTNVFAVGHPIFKSQDSIFRYDGSKWYRIAPPKTSYCNDVWGTSASEVFVACNFNILKYKGP